jgi:hypothetical protein
MPAWYDPVLQVASDSKRRARYRALQSWYRETQLGVEPGRSATGKLVGSLLPDDRALEGLNFLDGSIWSYAEQRADVVVRAGGTLVRGRLRRNLLSSMPLCFNLFGKLQAERAAAARVLGAALDLDIATVDEVLVEHAPAAATALLGDRTAFDAFVAYTTSGGATGFLGVETKYTEPFSPTRYPAGRYEPSPAFQAAGFRPGAAAAARLGRAATNQLLRNTLLAAATRRTGGYGLGHAVVIAGGDDRAARRAVASVRAELEEPDDLLRSVSLEQLIDHCHLEQSLSEWAAQFHQRYLDLSSIADRFPVSALADADPLAPRSPSVGPATIEFRSPAVPAQSGRSSFEGQVGQLAAHCRATLGHLSLLTEPAGYPDSLALCVLDAIWSLGVRYPAVQAVIARYQQHRQDRGGDPSRDSVQDLLATIDEVGSAEGFAELVGNRQRTATRGGILKAAAVASAARALAGNGIDSTRELRQATMAGQAEQLKQAWLAVPGQRSGISWRYLLMLAGVPEVKPDRMIRRFVADALQLADVPPQTAADLVKAVAALPPTVPIRALDHAIWRYQRTARARRDVVI